MKIEFTAHKELKELLIILLLIPYAILLIPFFLLIGLINGKGRG
jgi:hypothetical protein